MVEGIFFVFKVFPLIKFFRGKPDLQHFWSVYNINSMNQQETHCSESDSCPEHKNNIYLSSSKRCVSV